MTDYLVFEISDGTAGQIGPDRVPATSPDHAIRQVIATRAELRSDTFVAVPARSWKPRKVSTETVKRVRIGTA